MLTSLSARLRWTLPLCILWGVIAIRSLTFDYIDVDDTHSMEYHILGRDDSIQPPFERFQAGMDMILSMLPPDEPVVLKTGMTVTAVAALALVLLMTSLSLASDQNAPGGLKALAGIALVLAAPELVYLGLLYTPLLVGMCFALISHLIVRRWFASAPPQSPFHNAGGWTLLLSAALMGIAGIFRWDVLAYGLTVVADIVFDPSGRIAEKQPDMKKRTMIIMVWSVLAFIVWGTLVLLSGDLRLTLEELAVAAHETSNEARLDELRMWCAHLVFFTPGFVLFLLVGGISMFRRSRGGRWFVLILTAGWLLWPFWSTPKEMMVFIPFMALLWFHGFAQIWRRWTGLASRIAIALLLVIPWLVGVQMTLGDFAWGPGFELRPFTREAKTGVQGLSIGFQEGVGCPTREGPRPLFGHAWVLLGGNWRSLTQRLADERVAAIATAIDSGLPMFSVMRFDGFQVNTAARLGFTTRDPVYWNHDDRPIARVLSDGQGRSIRVVRFQAHRMMKDTGSVQLTIQALGQNRAVIWGEPNALRSIYLEAPDALHALGPQTAILDLNNLLEAVRRTQKIEVPA